MQVQVEGQGLPEAKNQPHGTATLRAALGPLREVRWARMRAGLLQCPTVTHRLAAVAEQTMQRLAR
jgi:hypothetical protein